MKVLSLFDGMSCGQIALNQLGIKADKYYASEIDKWAIQVTQKNYPDTIQLGDITKWREWDIDWASIDLVYGGSPCQGFSFAGKQLAFDDPRSKLFFEFVDIVNHIKSLNPDVKFLLENVRMKKEYLDVISEYMGVQPVMINSALVSAQNRVRFYWTNIGEIEQPEDRGILLKDIIESGEVDREKSLHQMVIVDSLYNNRPARVYKEKSPTIRSGRTGLIVTGGAIRGRYNEAGKTEQKLEVQHTGRANSITTVQKDSLCIQVGEADLKGHDSIKRVYSPDGKSPTLTTMGGGHREPKIAQPELTWRKLTPLECERLQTVPDGYTEGVSNTQRYRMLGNGWTVSVIKHIFSKLEAE
jgi:DNA-cytosine methyltransferase